MKRGIAAAFVVVALAGAGAARADHAIGIVIDVVDAGARRTLEDSVTAWLTKHDHPVNTSSLAKDRAGALVNCLFTSDMRCAREIVEANGQAPIVIALLAQVEKKKARARAIQLSAYWITKGRDVVSMQRTCDDCTASALAAATEAMMDDLVRIAPDMTSKLKVMSSPAGMLVTIDHEAFGTTPVEREIAPGKHVVVLIKDGHEVGKREIVVPAGSDTEVTVPVVLPPPPRPIRYERPSRAGPVTLIALGAVGVATGVALYVAGQPTGNSFYYTNTRPAGIASLAGGGVVAIVGVIWLVRNAGKSRPIVSLGPDHAIAGWAVSF